VTGSTGDVDPKSSTEKGDILLDSLGGMTRKYHRAPQWLREDQEESSCGSGAPGEHPSGSVGVGGSSGEEKEERDMFLELFCCCVFWCDQADDATPGSAMSTPNAR